MEQSKQNSIDGVAENISALFKIYPVLKEIWVYTNEIAKSSKILVAHNPRHMMWDAKTAEIIYSTELELNKSEEIGQANIKLIVAAALLHDIGAYLGEYKLHDITGQKHIMSTDFLSKFFGSIRKNLIDMDEIEKIATIVGEHNNYQQSTIESKILYDADTLNKAGIHGIFQSFNIQKEFGVNLLKVAQRMVDGVKKKLDSNYYYTLAAKKQDQSMGEHGLGGLETTQIYWENVLDILNERKYISADGI